MSALRILILILLLFAGAGKVISQNDTLPVNGKMHFDSKIIPLKKLIKSVEEKSNFTFNYSPSSINDTASVYLDTLSLGMDAIIDAIRNQLHLTVMRSGEKIYLLKNFSDLNIQKGQVISGFVKDKNSGEPLIGAVVYAKSPGLVTTTDEKGYFLLHLPHSDTIIISYIGYKKLKVDSGQLPSAFLSGFYLDRANVLEEVIIKDRSLPDAGLDELTMNRTVYDLNTLATGVAGGDVFERLVNLPGINKTNDFQGGISINGFAPGDNIYLLDGVRVFEPNHLFGLLSSYNANSINKIAIYRDDIPMHFPGVYSSVVNSFLKEGDFKKHRARISGGNMEAGIHIEGPVLKYKTSFVADGRLGLLNAYLPDLLKRYTPTEFNAMDFYDFSFKLTHRIKPGNKIEVFHYQSLDNIDIANDFAGNISAANKYKWSNISTGLSWRFLFRDNLQYRLLLSSAEYSNQYRTVFDVNRNAAYKKFMSLLSETKIKNLTVKNIFKYYGEKYIVTAGGGYDRFSLSPAIKSLVTDDPGTLPERIENTVDSTADVFNMYGEALYSGQKRLQIKGGAQFVLLKTKGYNKAFLNPKISVAYLVAKSFSVKLIYQKNIKYLHSLGQYALGLPSMLILNSNRNLKVSSTHGFGLSALWHYKKLDITSLVYYKSLKDILRYKNLTGVYSPVSSKGLVLPVFSFNDNPYQSILTGKGKAYGVNVRAALEHKRFTFNTAFSINRMILNFSGLNHGRDFVDTYDMLYSFSPGVIYHGRNMDFSAVLHLHSGQPATVPLYWYMDGGREILDYSHINNIRMDIYSSLNLSWSYRVKWEKAAAKIDLAIRNVLDNTNPVYVYVYKEKEKYSLSQLRGIPVFPYLKITIRTR